MKKFLLFLLFLFINIRAQFNNFNKSLTLQDLGFRDALEVKNLSDLETLLIMRKVFDISLNGKSLIAMLDDKSFMCFLYDYLANLVCDSSQASQELQKSIPSFKAGAVLDCPSRIALYSPQQVLKILRLILAGLPPK